MKYTKNHFAGILSVILAVVSLSGSSMPVVSANSAERIAKKETIVKLDEKLGAEPGKVLEELKTKIISNVTTGKIDVREVYIPEYDASIDEDSGEDDSILDADETEEQED